MVYRFMLPEFELFGHIHDHNPQLDAEIGRLWIFILPLENREVEATWLLLLY